MTLTSQELKWIAQDIESFTEERDQLDAMISELKDRVKRHMEENSVDLIEVDGYKMTLKTVKQNKFSQSAFKEAHADLYESFKRPSEYKRFDLTHIITEEE